MFSTCSSLLIHHAEDVYIEKKSKKSAHLTLIDQWLTAILSVFDRIIDDRHMAEHCIPGLGLAAYVDRIHGIHESQQ